jgi:hypothetical protein
MKTVDSQEMLKLVYLPPEAEADKTFTDFIAKVARGITVNLFGNGIGTNQADRHRVTLTNYTMLSHLVSSVNYCVICNY